MAALETLRLPTWSVFKQSNNKNLFPRMALQAGPPVRRAPAQARPCSRLVFQDLSRPAQTPPPPASDKLFLMSLSASVKSSLLL